MFRTMKNLANIFFVLFAVQAFTAPLDSLRNGHPRIIFTDEVRDRVLAQLDTDPLLRELFEVAEQYAAEQLDEPPIAYQFDGPGNPRLKAQRRASMFRIFNLGVLYRLTGNLEYAERVKADLLAAAQFKDWGPSHFLNIGEIGMLMGCGYDWIYDTLTEDEKDIIVNGIIENGLKEGIRAYNGNHPDGWWRSRKMNWNQVCNGGLLVSALAIADRDSATAAKILDGALKSIPHAMEGYKPDGAWYEGPTYFAYGTTYNALLIEATRTALGNAVDWQAIDGYESLGLSGNFHIQTVGPSNYYFNFGDSKDNLYFSPVMFWFSHTYNQPVYAAFERLLVERDLPRMRQGVMMDDDTLDRFFGLLLAWYDDRGQELSYDDLALDMSFSGETAVAAMRSGWDRDDIYLGFKGGYNQADHGHMDIGSFVLDADEIRWAVDLGGDHYDSLPGYFDFDNRRWNYFRCNNKGHNTLVIDDHIQNKNARVDIDEFYSAPDSAFASIDMSKAYIERAQNVVRDFIMKNNRQTVRIEDHIRFWSHESHARWGMITAADVNVMGTRAVLQQDGKYLAAKLIAPADGEFEIVSTKPDDPREDPNDGTRMLAVFIEADADKESEIIIELTPTGDPTAVLDNHRPAQPGSVVLEQNYPNPFNPATRIAYSLPSTAHVELAVFNIRGRLIKTVVNQVQPAGDYAMAVSMAGAPSGAYFYRLKAGDVVATRKMMFIE